jgi:hypothetical protein
MNRISEADFRELCHTVFDKVNGDADQSSMLRELLILLRRKLGHPRPITGFFGTQDEIITSIRREIVGLLLMRREPFFDSMKILDEFLARMRATE